MSLSMHQASVPVFVQMLSALNKVLDKAIAHAAARKIDQSVILGLRLYPDMLPFGRQVQIATDHAKNGSARLAGIEAPKFPDDEKNLEELKARVEKTIGFVKGLTPAQIDGSEEREITFPVGGKPMTFKGQPYLLSFAMPNFYFHTTAAYAILRHGGVEIGKRDFLGLS